MTNNNTPYLRNKIPTLLVFSATAIALLLTSSLLFSQALQPVQAQTLPQFFRTTQPAEGKDSCTNEAATITFDAKGTPSSSNPQRVDITGGTFQITSDSGQILYGGKVTGGSYTNSSNGGDSELDMNGQADEVTNETSKCVPQGSGDIEIFTYCITSDRNSILVLNSSNNYIVGLFPHAMIECSSSSSQGGGGNTTTHAIMQSPASSMNVTTAQDSDSDGIPDSSDRCDHNSNPRCFKEGDTTTQSSTSMDGNQTR